MPAETNNNWGKQGMSLPKSRNGNSSVPTRAPWEMPSLKLWMGKSRANDSERSNKSHVSAAYGGNKRKERA